MQGIPTGRSPEPLTEYLKDKVFSLQEFVLLSGRTLKSLLRAPRYPADVLIQMDTIGVGSLVIVLLTGFFSGAVLALQSYAALVKFGATAQTGRMVALSVIREMGPVMTALMVSGRNAAGIASELGSMTVTEQVDAMRALGVDPIKKLVAPRLMATVIVLPLLTIIADFIGIFGGFLISYFLIKLSASQYWNTVYQVIEYRDIVQGLTKPFVFAFAIALVGCYYGLTTRGGTQGVGRSTTQAVVTASILVFVLDFLITKVFVQS